MSAALVVVGVSLVIILAAIALMWLLRRNTPEGRYRRAVRGLRRAGGGGGPYPLSAPSNEGYETSGSG